MPIVKMSRTERGSPDGINVERYLQGVEYDVPDSLVLAFQTMGAIEAPEDAMPGIEQPAAEAMSIPPAPRRGRPRKERA